MGNPSLCQKLKSSARGALVRLIRGAELQNSKQPMPQPATALQAFWPDIRPVPRLLDMPDALR
jgi:hypothetical protein